MRKGDNLEKFNQGFDDEQEAAEVFTHQNRKSCFTLAGRFSSWWNPKTANTRQQQMLGFNPHLFHEPDLMPELIWTSVMKEAQIKDETLPV